RGHREADRYPAVILFANLAAILSGHSYRLTPCRSESSLRALVLLQLAKGASAPRIADGIPLPPQAIRNSAHRCAPRGLAATLHEKQRPGAAAMPARSSGLSPWSVAILCL